MDTYDKQVALLVQLISTVGNFGDLNKVNPGNQVSLLNKLYYVCQLTLSGVMVFR